MLELMLSCILLLVLTSLEEASPVSKFPAAKSSTGFGVGGTWTSSPDGGVDTTGYAFDSATSSRAPLLLTETLDEEGFRRMGFGTGRRRRARSDECDGPSKIGSLWSLSSPEEDPEEGSDSGPKKFFVYARCEGRLARTKKVFMSKLLSKLTLVE